MTYGLLQAGRQPLLRNLGNAPPEHRLRNELEHWGDGAARHHQNRLYEVGQALLSCPERDGGLENGLKLLVFHLPLAFMGHIPVGIFPALQVIEGAVAIGQPCRQAFTDCSNGPSIPR